MENEQCSEVPIERISQEEKAEAETAKELNEIFSVLKEKPRRGLNLIDKRKKAEAVLRGEYGMKHELFARLLLSPRDLEEIFSYSGDVVPAMVGFAKNNDPEVRIKVAKVLGERGDARAIPALCQGMREGLDENLGKEGKTYWIRYEFISALCRLIKKLNDEQDLEEVEKRLTAYPKPGEISGAIRILKKHRQQLGNRRDPQDGLKTMPKPDMSRPSPGRRENSAPMSMKRQ